VVIKNNCQIITYNEIPSGTVLEDHSIFYGEDKVSISNVDNEEASISNIKEIAEFLMA
jgi:hypothetical protein